MWCGYVCAPDQSFVTILGTQIVPDVLNNANATVLAVRILMDRASACDLFASCQDTTYVTEDSAIGDCMNFLKYQGVTEGIGHGNDIDFVLTQPNTSASEPRLVLNNLKCGDYVLPGSNVSQSCSCVSCRTSTTCLSSKADVDVLQGFSLTVVLCYYLGILLVTIAVVCWRSMTKRTKSPKPDPLEFHAAALSLKA
jgi:hypothetical protein